MWIGFTTFFYYYFYIESVVYIFVVVELSKDCEHFNI